MERMEATVSIVHVERITCDNAECASYVEELIREEPGRFELQEYLRAQVSSLGWTQQDGSDFCPDHS
jgi:hypothetical protein